MLSPLNAQPVFTIGNVHQYKANSILPMPLTSNSHL